MNDLHLRERVIRLAAARPELRPHLLAVIAASAMPEPTFWGLVRDLGWGTRSTDYKAMKKHLLRSLSPNDAAGFATTFSQLKGQLYKAVDKWVDAGDTWLETGKHGNPRELGIGDDSFSDLLAHIIGLGKAEYDAVMRDPELAWKRARKGDYKESFTYVIPYASDYALLDVRSYQQSGERITDLASWLLHRPEIPRALFGSLTALVDGFARLNGYQVHKFVEQEPLIVGAAKIVQDWWDKADWDLRSTLLQAMPDRMMEPGHIYWGVKNLVTDVKDFLVD